MPNAYHIAGSGNTGDGHLICAKLGAKFWHLNSMAGGPVRTAKDEILDLDGNAIPGLYSAGEFGSVWCDMYQGGGNLSERVNFARICVDSILG